MLEKLFGGPRPPGPPGGYGTVSTVVFFLDHPVETDCYRISFTNVMFHTSQFVPGTLYFVVSTEHVHQIIHRSMQMLPPSSSYSL